MHVRFEAEVPHADAQGEVSGVTKFLALDKPQPNPRRIFLECFEVPQEFDEQEEDAYALQLSYDPAWLAILKSTDFLTEVTNRVGA